MHGQVAEARARGGITLTLPPLRDHVVVDRFCSSVPAPAPVEDRSDAGVPASPSRAPATTIDERPDTYPM